MNTKLVLTITAVLSVVYAAALISMPSKFMEMRGLDANVAAVLMAKVLGANAFGWALLAWFGRGLTGDSLRPILIAMIGGWGLSGLLIARAMMTLKPESAMGWGDAGLSVAFALIYAYFLFAKKA